MSEKRKAVRVSVLLGEDVMKDIDEMVEYAGTSRSSLIAQIVANQVKSQKLVKTTILGDPAKFEGMLKSFVDQD